MTNPLPTILAGIDFTPASETALIQAAHVAGWSRARLEAVHVIELFSLAQLKDTFQVAMTGTHKALVEDAHRRWSAFSAGISAASSVTFQSRVDETVAGLVRAARETSAQLLVLGSESDGRNERIGPVASGCAQRSPCDVLLVRHPHAYPYSGVLACIDFSPTSTRVLEQAIRFAVADNAALYIAHAYAAPWRRRNPDGHGLDADFQHAYERELLEKLKEFCSPFEHELCCVKPIYRVVGHQRAARGLALLAGELHAELVVIGTRGHGNVHDLLLGSTAERVLGLAQCSVLAVKPPKERADP